MARQKCKRCISFQPPYSHFTPNDIQETDTITLLAEESEALYLMDLLELYQEEAATKMQVSRPTFARIIKSARHKVALALLEGRQLYLETKQENYVLALCSESETSPYTMLTPKSKYIHIFTLNKHHIESVQTILNPIVTQHLKPAIALTELFVEHNVTVFMTSMIGQGFRSILASQEIEVMFKEHITTQEIEALW